ncbi:MAG TPA: FAD-dependent oxidoreductase [Ohtaekwangia sp.]|nr:FAD-dependent oxidoreductase [Ohtaekwangia sp.]
MTLNLNTFSPAAQNDRPPKDFPQFIPRQSITVIGAGAFGGWTALHFLRKGFEVTMVDAWGAGNARSSSGDETRVIRSTYGANEFYFNLNVRSLHLWKENELRFNRKLFYNTGVLWLCHEEHTALVDDSIPYANAAKMEYEYLTTDQVNKRFSILNTSDLHHGYFDPFGGYLKAREACVAVCEAFQLEGGTYLQASVKPGNIRSGSMDPLTLSTGETLKSDFYIFACGSWLGKLFPDILGNYITCTKQEVYYFGVPENQSLLYDHFPVWVDADGKDFYYGIANNTSRGFKVGVDKRGVSFDPTGDERILDEDVLKEARTFLEHRFPGLQDAPLLESRVCPYENSPTGNFLFDIHPDADNVFFLGGGSGHGFKHGPALGELVSNVLTGVSSAPSIFMIND